MNNIFSLLIALLFLVACSNSSDSDTVRDSARESLGDPQPTNVAPPIGAPSAPTAINASVKHYTCPNNCEGTYGDAAGTCPVCGSELQHNQAYHNQPQAGTANPGATNPGAISTQTVTPPAEPAQNAAGVWHYTCGNGCEGGAGSAIACATCGSTLVHNTAYHN